ncbi:Cell death protease [Dinochytrium kinnereticum]|nr:Cell death protease [Dinochytrium kinnereticum]
MRLFHIAYAFAIWTVCIGSGLGAFLGGSFDELREELRMKAVSLKGSQKYAVTSLPGLSDEDMSKFKMHAGLMDVGNDSSLFFWLIQPNTEKPPERLLIWLNGGPGCSSMDGLFMEYGPLRVSPNQTITLNPYSWHTLTPILFLDQPVGTGYSRGMSVGNMEEVTEGFGRFLGGFLGEGVGGFGSGVKLYIGGESFAGVYVPYFAKSILEKSNQTIHLSGLLLGNPLLDTRRQSATYLEFAVKNNVITVDQAQKMKPLMEDCQNAAEHSERISVPECSKLFNSVLEASKEGNLPCVNMYDLRLRDATPADGCGLYGWPDDLRGMKAYLSRKDVRMAVNVGEGDGEEWVECRGEAGERLRTSLGKGGGEMLPMLLEKIPVVVFSGDKDLVCNVDGISSTLSHLTWNGQQGMQTAPTVPWKLLDGSVAGMFRSARNLTNVVVFGASHMVGVGKGRESLEILRRFLGDDWGGGVDNGVEVAPPNPPLNAIKMMLSKAKEAYRHEGIDEKRLFGSSPFGKVRLGDVIRGDNGYDGERESENRKIISLPVREVLVDRVNYHGHRDWQ